MLNFTALDFETANCHRGSPCSIGLVKVRHGKPSGERHWLMRPPEAYDNFDYFNVSLHHITPELVRNEPRWHERLPAILDFIGGDVVIAHNAAFDIGVMRDACGYDEIECPSLDFLCTLVMSRQALDLPSFRLPFVMDALGLPFGNHHNALADAHAAGAVASGLAAMTGVDDLGDLARALHIGVGQVRPGVYRGSCHDECSRLSRALVMPSLSPGADPDGYLFGRVVVFTGTLGSMSRQTAWEACAQVGANAEAGVTKRTNVLVVGMEIDLLPGAPLTNKAAHAASLRAKGQDIEVMNEVDFLRSLG
jgi:DNA polymerase-3 subunit epsilon